jgi:hypothetical protein
MLVGVKGIAAGPALPVPVKRIPGTKLTRFAEFLGSYHQYGWPLPVSLLSRTGEIDPETGQATRVVSGPALPDLPHSESVGMTRDSGTTSHSLIENDSASKPPARLGSLLPRHFRSRRPLASYPYHRNHSV